MRIVRRNLPVRRSSDLLTAPHGGAVRPASGGSRRAWGAGGIATCSRLTINGVRHQVDVDPGTPLLWVLRDVLGMTGTKYGCGIEVCGACTVLLDGEAEKSCHIEVSEAAQRRVTTIEGLRAIAHGKALQQAWIEEQVPQCGYCQSGMLMAAAALMRENPHPSDAAIENAMRNVCVCGTYQRVEGDPHGGRGSDGAAPPPGLEDQPTWDELRMDETPGADADRGPAAEHRARPRPPRAVPSGVPGRRHRSADGDLRGGRRRRARAAALRPRAPPGATRAAAAATPAAAGAGAVTGWVTVNRNGTVTIRFPGGEMGQGSLTGLSQAVAEELKVDWGKVRWTAAPARNAYFTAGSSAIRFMLHPMRVAGAQAREMLIAAAAQTWGSPHAATPRRAPSSTRRRAGPALRQARRARRDAARPGGPAHHGRRGPRGSWARRHGAWTSRPRRTAPRRTASTCACPGWCTPPSSTRPRSAASSGARPDAPGRPAGRAPGQCVRGHRDQHVARLPGCRGAGGVLDRAGRRDGQFQRRDPCQGAGSAGERQRRDGRGARRPGRGPRRRGPGGRRHVRAPLPGACAHGGAQLHGPPDREAVRDLGAHAGADLGHRHGEGDHGPARGPIVVHPMLMGGGLGRKFEQDYVAQAIHVAKALGKPVKLTWSREEDFSHDQYRPMALSRVRAGLDGNGDVVGWANRIVQPSIMGQRGWKAPGDNDSQCTEGATDLPYDLGARRVEYLEHPATVPVGFWRSVGHSINAFVVESFIDELAAAAGMGPLAFRRKLLQARTATSRCWRRPRSWAAGARCPVGHARGIALAESFGSIVAEVAEVSRTGPSP